MTHLVPVLDFLASREGVYEGHGTNAEGLSFKARMELRSRVAGHLVEVVFRAEDVDSAFHEEATWITEDLVRSRLALWTVSTNTPGILQHDLAEDGEDDLRERRLVFRLGDTADTRRFRQEITVDFMRDGSVEYRYGWGIPHEPFASRIRTQLRPSPAR